MKRETKDTAALLQDLDIELSHVLGICQAGKHAMASTYTQKMSHEEIAGIFEGIAKLIKPVQDELWKLSERLEDGKSS